MATRKEELESVKREVVRQKRGCEECSILRTEKKILQQRIEELKTDFLRTLSSLNK